MLNEALKKEVGEEAVPAVRRRRSKTQTLSILSGGRDGAGEGSLVASN